jgi:hypothetical protein
MAGDAITNFQISQLVAAQLAAAIIRNAGSTTAEAAVSRYRDILAELQILGAGAYEPRDK